MFIHATAARHFDGGNGLTFDTTPDFLGEIPDWLKTNDYFNACVKDHTITYVGAPPAAATVDKNAKAAVKK